MNVISNLEKYFIILIFIKANWALMDSVPNHALSCSLVEFSQSLLLQIQTTRSSRHQARPHFSDDGINHSFQDLTGNYACVMEDNPEEIRLPRSKRCVLDLTPVRAYFSIHMYIGTELDAT